MPSTQVLDSKRVLDGEPRDAHGVDVEPMRGRLAFRALYTVRLVSGVRKFWKRFQNIRGDRKND